MELKIEEREETLLVWYPSESAPQPCYLSLDLRNDVADLSCVVRGSTGPGVPVAEHNGRMIRWRIRSLTPAGANALMRDVEPIAQRIANGYSERWDGHNIVGVLSDEARDACQQMTAWIELRDYPADEIWDAADWYAPLGSREAQARQLGITATSTDAELAALAEREESHALAPCHQNVRVRGLIPHLEWLREHARDVAAKTVGS